MAVQQNKKSKQKIRQRKASLRKKPGQTGVCTHCGEPKRPHRVCPSCGHYKGEEILAGGEE